MTPTLIPFVSIRQWREGRRERAAAEIEQIIANEFNIVERDGNLFLTHDGVAFEQIPADTPASEIAVHLHNARTTAISYHASRQ